MKYVEVIAESTSSNTITAIAEKAKALDFRQGIVGEDGMQQMRMLLDDDQLQLALDTLENVLGAQPTARVVVFPIEASWPKNESKVATKNEAAAREVIYQEVEKGSRLDSNYMSPLHGQPTLWPKPKWGNFLSNFQFFGQFLAIFCSLFIGLQGVSKFWTHLS